MPHRILPNGGPRIDDSIETTVARTPAPRSRFSLTAVRCLIFDEKVSVLRPRLVVVVAVIGAVVVAVMRRCC